MARPEDHSFGLIALKYHALQGGLRGIDPRNGKMLPYETELVNGQTATITQESVDMANLYSALRREAEKEVRSISRSENLDTLVAKLQKLSEQISNPSQTTHQKKLL